MCDSAVPVQKPVAPTAAGTQALLDLAPDGIFVADIHGVYTYVNAAGCRMLGYECDEIVGRTIFDLIAKSDVERLLRSKAAMLKGGRSDASEWLLRRKDGTWLPVEVHANILPNGQWQGFVRDISARKALHAEREALFEQMEKDRRWLRAVLDTLPIGVVLFEGQARVSANRHAEQLLGMKVLPGEGSRQYADRIFHPDGRPAEPLDVACGCADQVGEAIIAVEYLIRRHDGTQTPVLGSAAPITAADGSIIGCVWVFQDVSERMRLERVARENEHLLKAVFDLLPVGVWIADRSGRIVSNNPAGESIWRGVRYVPVEEFGQYKGWWADTGKPIAAEEWALARALTKGETSLGELVRIQCFDGTTKTIINWAAPLRDERGDVSGAIVVNEDITALHQTQEQLRAAVRDREHILAVVAHDLRNPLSAIMLQASLAEQRAQLPVDVDALHASAVSIGEIARRMSGMVDDLLAISAASGRSMLKFEPVLPAVLVAKAVEAAGPLLAQAGLELALEIVGELPVIHVDVDRILRVFANLLDNARKFTERPGRVLVRAESAHGAVLFSVANTGPPLRALEMERMFRPFWQAGGEDRRGVGLGLSICRSIIEAHAGSIWAEAAKGMRVKTCFLLPCFNPGSGGAAALRPEVPGAA